MRFLRGSVAAAAASHHPCMPRGSVAVTKVRGAAGGQIVQETVPAGAALNGGDAGRSGAERATVQLRCRRGALRPRRRSWPGSVETMDRTAPGALPSPERRALTPALSRERERGKRRALTPALSRKRERGQKHRSFE